MDDVLRKALSGEPDARRDQSSGQGLLDRFGLNSNAYEKNGLFDVEDGDVLGRFWSAESQNDPDYALGEPDFGVVKRVKWKIPVFNGEDKLMETF